MKLLWPEATKPVVLAGNEAHVWAVPLDDCPPREELWPLLSVDERQRAERFRFEELRTRFLASRAAVRTLLGEYLTKPPALVEFTCDPGGRHLQAGAGGIAATQHVAGQEGNARAHVARRNGSGGIRNRTRRPLLSGWGTGSEGRCCNHGE